MVFDFYGTRLTEKRKILYCQTISVCTTGKYDLSAHLLLPRIITKFSTQKTCFVPKLRKNYPHATGAYNSKPLDME